MATFIPPKRGVELVLFVGLISRASRPQLQANPTLAAGDVQVSKDGGAFANLTTLPAVTPASGRAVKVTLSATEMAADQVAVTFIDAAGAEWDDLIINIPTAARQIDDLAFPAISGRSIVVDAAGLADATTVKVGPTGAGTAQTAGDIIGDTNDLQSKIGTPAGASVSADIAAIEAQTNDIGVAGAGLTALGDARLANLDATVSSRASAAALSTVQADTDDIQTRLPAALDTGRMVAKAEVVTDKTGYALTSAQEDAIVNKLWDELTAEARTAGSYGQLLKDNLNAAVASRSVPGDAMALTAGAVDAVHDEVFEGTLTFRQFQRIALAALAGKSTGFPAGPAVYRDNADLKARVTATVDADGNRSAVTLDGT